MFDSLIANNWVPLLAAPLVGSFAGLLVVRLPAGEPVTLGRSVCRHCGEVLAARDLVPIVSWLCSGGRCRYCGALLNFLYPGIEVGALVIALWATSAFSGWLLWASCALGWCLLTLAVFDLRYLLLPDSVTLALVVAGLAVVWAIDPESVPDHAVGVFVGFGAFAALRWIYRSLRKREGLGLGDAKLLAGAGAWVSWWGLPSVVLLGALSALTVTLILSIVGKRMSANDEIPFGSHLCFAIWLVWLYGPLELA